MDEGAILEGYKRACLVPTKGDREEAIARLDELIPEVMEGLLAGDSKTAAEEHNLLMLVKAHFALEPASASKFLVRVCVDSPFPENRHIAKSMHDKMIESDLATVFFSLEETDRSLAKQIVASKRLLTVDPLALEKCDFFDPSRIMRTMLQLQSSPDENPSIDVTSSSIIDEVFRQRPELARRLFVEGAAREDKKLLACFSAPLLVRLLAYAGESAEAVATGFHECVLQHAIARKHHPVLRFLMKNHMEDVIVPAISKAKSPSTMQDALIPFLSFSAMHDFLRFIATFDYSVSLATIRSLLHQLRPVNRRMTRIFSSILAWLNSRSNWIWTLATITQNLAQISPSLLGKNLMASDVELHGKV